MIMNIHWLQHVPFEGLGSIENNNRVLGLQFHLETTLESAIPLIQNCRNELVVGPSIQTELEIIDGIK